MRSMSMEVPDLPTVQLYWLSSRARRVEVEVIVSSMG